MSAERDLTGVCLRGKWTLESKLGEGGMAVVYAATHHSGLQRAAIKVLRAHFAADPDIRKRFQREGRAAQSLNHPGAVRILDDDETEDGLAFLVMELLEGETWKACWQRCGKRLPVADVLMSSIAVLEILQAAHDVGVVHRDIKPENVFLTTAGEVKLLDFGIARVFESASERTQTGAMLGTPAYMSPEQALAKWSQVDGRSDLFSLGASMRSLLTGVSLHEATTGSEALVLAATQQARPFQQLCANAPSSLAAVIDRSIRFSKEDRYDSAGEMRDALLQLLEHDELPSLLEPPGNSSSVDGTAETLAANGATPSVATDSARKRTMASARTGQQRELASAGTLVSASDARPAPTAAEPGSRWRWFTGVGLIAIMAAVALGVTLRSPVLEPTKEVAVPPTEVDGMLHVPHDATADAQPSGVVAPSPSSRPSSVTMIPTALDAKQSRKIAEDAAQARLPTMSLATKNCNLKVSVAVTIRVANDGRWHARLGHGPRPVQASDGCVLGAFNTSTRPFEGPDIHLSTVVTP